jgi:ketosteroid isomerase-like protein
MPSDAQVEVVVAFFDALKRLDRSAADMVTPDCEASLSAFVSGGREYRGPEGVHEWFDRVEANDARGSMLSVRTRRMLGDRDDPDVVAVVAQVSIARDAGGLLENESAYVMRMRDLLIARIEGFLDRDEGIAKLGDPYDLG